MSGYDVAIIGGGPGGYTAAIRAGQLNKRAVLIECGDLGGVCLNRGCIPTKAYAVSAAVLRKCKHAEEFGVVLEGTPHIDFTKVQDRKRAILATLRKGIGQLLDASGTEVVHGTAHLTSTNEITVDDKRIQADHIVVATGSSWIELANLKPDGIRIQNSDHAMAWHELPQSVVIVGGGYIGCEFASFMNTMGVEVTIIEAMDQVLSNVDKTISKVLQKRFVEDGIRVITDAPVESTKVHEDHVEISLQDGTTMKAETVMVSVGRKPEADGLGLDELGVERGRRGEILVNDRFQTNIKSVHAVGDVNGMCLLAHAASEQAISCINSMFGGEATYDNNCVPSCIFSEPEVGYVGKNAEQLKNEGVTFKTGRFAFASLGKAHVDGSTEGQVIIYADENDKILGVHVIGNNATGIVAEATVAVKRGMTTNELADVIHAHPTVAEVLAEAARDANNWAIHKVSRRRRET